MWIKALPLPPTWSGLVLSAVCRSRLQALLPPALGMSGIPSQTPAAPLPEASPPHLASLSSYGCVLSPHSWGPGLFPLSHPAWVSPTALPHPDITVSCFLPNMPFLWPRCHSLPLIPGRLQQAVPFRVSRGQAHVCLSHQERTCPCLFTTCFQQRKVTSSILHFQKLFFRLMSQRKLRDSGK